MSPVLRLAKNEYGSDSVCLKNCDIIVKSSLRTMKFASTARIVAISCVNTLEMIRPPISRCSRLTFWCTITPSRMFWMIIGGTMPSIWITKVARNRCSRILLVRHQVAREPHPRRARCGLLRQSCARREDQAGAAPAALELFEAQLPEAHGRVGHPHVPVRNAVHHHVVVALPVHDQRQVEAAQVVERALHAARREAERLAGARQAFQRRALVVTLAISRSLPSVMSMP